MVDLAPTQRPGWAYRSAWTAHAVPGRHGRGEGEAGVRLRLVDRPILATLVAARDAGVALSDLLGARGCLPPKSGRCTFGRGFALVWTARAQWLVVADTAAVLDTLVRNVGDLAGVVAQSDSRALLCITGPNALDVLAKGLAIDLHPDMFTDGSAAATGLIHLSAQIWRSGDVYWIAVARSSCGSVWSWLTAAAAEYGCVVEEG